jgi:hypothetical protein
MINEALHGIIPGATEWAGSSIYGTFYREQAPWCAMVSPSERDHRPGYDVDVWLSRYGPNEHKLNRLAHEHVSSASMLERTAASLTRAMRLADAMLAARSGPS